MIRAVIALAFVCIGLLLWNEHTERKAADARETFAREQRDAIAQTLDAEKKNRAEDQRRYAASDQIIAAGRRELDAARIDATDASAARDRVRGQFDAAVARARRAASNPAPVASGPSTFDSPLVLANLFEKLSGRAKRLAERSTQFSDLADQRGVAGSICERKYDSLTGATQ